MSKACILSRATVPERTGAVSVLDLEQYRFQARSPDDPILGTISDTDVVSLYTMSIRPIGRSDTFANVPDGLIGIMVEPIGIEPMTLCLQSRCSPS